MWWRRHLYANDNIFVFNTRISFMWSRNQSNLTRWFLERNVSWSDFSFLSSRSKYDNLQKWGELPVSKRDGRLEKKKLICTICETHLLHGRFRLLDLILCSEFLCLKGLGHLSSTPKKWTCTQFTFHRRVSPNDTMSVTTCNMDVGN